MYVCMHACMHACMYIFTLTYTHARYNNDGKVYDINDGDLNDIDD